ncbi:hypothetical protein IWX49DRAFT_551236 [Phyllosticta citricarpa]|uniref:Glycosyltransferase family 34 protein n=1 Tax=Phyllosticta citricarpa TaxID=55181 RepID=A0ABR1MEJ8_9PEZI
MLLLYHQTRAILITALFLVFCLLALLRSAILSQTQFSTTTTNVVTHLRGTSFWKTAHSKLQNPLGHREEWRVPLDTERIITASVQYEPDNELYERALKTHERYAERWGYGFEVLRKELLEGWWGKWSWLLGIVARELNKQAEDGVLPAEWIMFVSPSTVVTNPHLPASIFLPPRNHKLQDPNTTNPTHDKYLVDFSSTYFVGTFDTTNPMLPDPSLPALSTTSFFMRINKWTFHFIARMLVTPLNFPTFVDEASAMALTLNEMIKNEGLRCAITEPAAWFAGNFDLAPGSPEAKAKEEENPDAAEIGGIAGPPRLVDWFPETLGGRRWMAMKEVLDEVEAQTDPLASRRRKKTHGKWLRKHGRGAAGLSSYSSSYSSQVTGSGSASAAADDNNNNNNNRDFNDKNANDTSSSLSTEAKTLARLRAGAASPPDPAAMAAAHKAVDAFWARATRARVAVMHAEELLARWRETDQQGRPWYEDVQDRIKGVERAVAWTAGKGSALNESIALMRDAMAGGGKIEDDGA